MLAPMPGGSGQELAGPTLGSLSIDTSLAMVGSLPDPLPMTPPGGASTSGTMPLMERSDPEGAGSLTPTTSLASTPKSSKKAKPDKEKDPNAPKKPANAFFMFCQQQRAAVQETYFKVSIL